MRRTNFRNLLLLGFVALAAVLLSSSGCGDSTEPNTGPGTLRLKLVDAPQCVDGLEHLYLVLSDVTVHRGAEDTGDSGEWFSVMPDTLTEEQRTIDLLDYVNGASLILGEEDLPSDFYSQVRLQLEKSWIVIDGDSLGLTVPSGMQSGLKLVHGFTISPGLLTELTLDWDACRSLVETPPGSAIWKLKPTIKIMESRLAGSISGTVVPLDIGANVMGVSSDLADTSITQVDPVSGGYVLQALRPGGWDLTAFAPGYNDSTKTGIMVQAGVENSGNDFTLVEQP